MEYIKVKLESKTVVGKSIKTTNENEQCVAEIGALWQAFIGQGIYESIENKVDQTVIGLYCDYEGDATKPYRVTCCAEVNEVKEQADLEVREIPSGIYAKFTIKGHMVEAVGAAWQEIWAMDLNRSFVADFELYHNDSEDMNHQTIDIYISLNE